MKTLFSNLGYTTRKNRLAGRWVGLACRLAVPCALGLLVTAAPLRAEQVPQPVTMGKDGHLVYKKDAQGNRIIDFSYAGYEDGGKPLPDVTAKVTVEPSTDNDGYRIQQAIDFVSQLPLDKDGFRGAVVLKRGTYHIAGALHINASGVVLRGQGSGVNGTILVAAGVGRRTLIQVDGKNDRRWTTDSVKITDDYVPVGSMSVHVSNPGAFKVGQTVIVNRPSPENWIKAVGMNVSPARMGLHWHAGKMDMHWDRVIEAIHGNELVLNAPITNALEQRFGGGTVRGYTWPGRLHHVGIEQLRCISPYDGSNPKDESHSWMAVQLDDIQDAWVANVTGVHFCSSVVAIGYGGLAVTVQDCTSLAPVSEDAGYRRHTFHTDGELTLFLRCLSEHGFCDYTVGYLSTGPNVFLRCKAVQSSDVSGGIGSWATGMLFDNVNIDHGILALDNLETRYQGVGWAAANSVLWQSNASRLICRMPPGAANWSIGNWAQFKGDGNWVKSNEFVNPDSLYETQLVERLGRSALAALKPRMIKKISTDAVPVEEAVLHVTHPAPAPKKPGEPMALTNGWLTDPQGLMTGKATQINWWRGQLVPDRQADFGPNITRYVPGYYGRGATDILSQVAANMKKNNSIDIWHHWGLWYDQRSDDHEMVRRFDADVWPPFYVQPWARSGQGHAWDNLSKYDLTKFNPWYFNRLRKFADIGRKDGVVLINEMYFQHNILEAGAHWASFPWRPANCLQDTGFPEPPNYFNRKRNFMAMTFYDVTNPVRRELHRLFIRHCLDNLVGEPNVIDVTGEEFTGPLSFVQFWVDTVAEWEKDTGHHPLIGLSTPKNDQDAILADPHRRDVIDVIDIKYWWNTKHGLYAPKGGQNLSPRQSERKWKGGYPGPAYAAQMVHEYRSRFPQKAVICQLPGIDGWAVLGGGGSFPNLPKTLDAGLRAAIPAMLPVEAPKDVAGHEWVLGARGQGYFVFAVKGGPVKVDLSSETGSFTVHRIDLSSGELESRTSTVRGGRVVSLPDVEGHESAYWLTKS